MQFDFTGRKPSKAQVKAKLAGLMKANPPTAIVTWGENSIEAIRIGKESGAYIGQGWIREISGADLVREIQGPGSLPAWKY